MICEPIHSSEVRVVSFSGLSEVATAQASVGYHGAAARADNYRAGDDFRTSTATGRIGHTLPTDEVGSTAYRVQNHTLDLAYGYWCTAKVAARVGDRALAEEFTTLASRWVNAFDAETGLLRDSTFYEGSRYNYSFRLVHDMRRRIELSGGDVCVESEPEKGTVFTVRLPASEG